MPHNHLTDEELVHAYHRDGDKQWLGYLLQRYTALLFGVAMKYLKDKDHAEDAVQQVFIKVLTHLPQGELLNFKGWLYVLMRNYCLQQLRDKMHNIDVDALQHIATGPDDHNDIHWHEHTLQQLEAAIQTLSEEQRITITLFYLEKNSYEQIIARTGYTFMQVKSYIQNGKRNLKTILMKKLGNRLS